MRRPLLALLEKLLDHVDYRRGDVSSGAALCLQVLEDAAHIPDDGSILLGLCGRPFAEVNHFRPSSDASNPTSPGLLRNWGEASPFQNMLDLGVRRHRATRLVAEALERRESDPAASPLG